MTLLKGHTSSPKRYFRAVKVELCTDYIHVTATKPPTKLQTVGAWASQVGAQVGVNGDFFKYTTPPRVYGDAVGDGEFWPLPLTGVDTSGSSNWYHHNYGWIAVGPGWVEFTHSEHVKKNAAAFEAAGYTVSKGWRPNQVAPDPPKGTLALVSGFSELVIEGKLYTCPDPAKPDQCFPDRGDMSQLHKRTAMGITKDRQTLIFLIMTSSTYGKELAEVIYELGAWEAFNLDGGGSSTLWTKSAGYLFPSATVLKRAVANHWGIFAGAQGGQNQEPGHCFQNGGCFATPVIGAESSVFADYPSSWYHYGAAVALLDEGLTNGCGKTDAGVPMFCPKCEISRREFAVFLVKAAGIDVSSPPNEATFIDVPKSDWAFAYVEAMVAVGITNGCGNDKFCPDKTVTRGQSAKFLRKAAGWKTETPNTPTFDDVPKDYIFFGSIEAVAKNCVTNGCDKGNFCPNDPITRGQAAKFLVKTFDIQDMNSCIDYCNTATCKGGKTCAQWGPCEPTGDPCDTVGAKTRLCTTYADCKSLSLDPTCGAKEAEETQECTIEPDCPEPAPESDTVSDAESVSASDPDPASAPDPDPAPGTVTDTVAVPTSTPGHATDGGCGAADSRPAPTWMFLLIILAVLRLGGRAYQASSAN